jgi:putative transposase
MPLNLKRYQQEGDDHFITFSCYHRKPYLQTSAARELVEASLEAARSRYGFQVLGYVIMPEHVHLLLSEPECKPLGTALGALKLSVSKQSQQRPFWQTRYYDFNVFTHDKRVEKIKYMHRNPVVRGLVDKPEDWRHSSYCHYLRNEASRVTITNPF